MFIFQNRFLYLCGVLIMERQKTINLVLFGKTGSGKSELINYLIGIRKAKTGIGMPVTNDFDEYVHQFRDGTIIHVFDSEGFESGRFVEQEAHILAFLNDKYRSRDIRSWPHILFYCVSLSYARFEEEEAEFIRKIEETTLCPVTIVITNCELGFDSGETVKMEKRIKDCLGEETRIFFVNSDMDTFDNENPHPRRSAVKEETPHFGRDDIINELEILAWNSVSSRMSKDYSSKIYTGLGRILIGAYKELCDHVESANSLSLIRGKVSACKLKNSRKNLSQLIKQTQDENQTRINFLISMIDLECNEGAFDFSEWDISPQKLADGCISLDLISNQLSPSKLSAKCRKEYENLKGLERVEEHIEAIIHVKESMKSMMADNINNKLSKVVDNESVDQKYYNKMQDLWKKNRKPRHIRGGKPGRNDLCPCGSGKKFKHCCQGKGKYD